MPQGTIDSLVRLRKNVERLGYFNGGKREGRGEGK